mgnify:CR=1 FL=1
MALPVLRALIARQQRGQYPAPHTLIIQPPVEAHVTREPDGDLIIAWERAARQAAVYCGTQPDAIPTDAPIAVVSNGREARITGLDPAIRHYFRLVFDDGAALTVAERFLPLAGGVNFRDIGGYLTDDGARVRWGLVYRSGGLADLTDDDMAYLERIGLRLACDLRTGREATANPDRLPPGVEYLPAPVLGDSETSFGPRKILLNLGRLDAIVTGSYTAVMLDQKAAVFGGWLRRLADPASVPAVIHCTAGKDRTGIAIALLLALLGVPEEVIVADYSLSNLYFEHFRETMAPYTDRLAQLRLDVSDVLPLLSADPRTMRASLAHLRARYGSVAAYLSGPAGLDAETLARIRAALLDRG